MSTFGDVPVESGEINENDCVGPALLKCLVGQTGEAIKGANILDEVVEEHHGKLAERINQFAACCSHAFAAEADDLGSGLALAELRDQVRAVHISARLAGTDEKAHASGILAQHLKGFSVAAGFSLRDPRKLKLAATGKGP